MKGWIEYIPHIKWFFLKLYLCLRKEYIAQGTHPKVCTFKMHTLNYIVSWHFLPKILWISDLKWVFNSATPLLSKRYHDVSCQFCLLLFLSLEEMLCQLKYFSSHTTYWQIITTPAASCEHWTKIQDNLLKHIRIPFKNSELG